MLLSFIRLRFWEHDNRGRSKRTKLRETAEAGGAGSKGQTFWGGTGRWLRFLMSVAEAFPGTKQDWNAPLSQMCLRIQDVSPVWFLIARKCSSSCECHLTSLTKMPTTNKSLPSAWRSYSGTLPEQMWHNNNCEICSDSVCSFLLKLTWNIWLEKTKLLRSLLQCKKKKRSWFNFQVNWISVPRSLPVVYTVQYQAMHSVPQAAAPTMMTGLALEMPCLK